LFRDGALPALMLQATLARSFVSKQIKIVMPQAIEFFRNHPILVMAFIGIVAGLVWTFIGGRTKGVTRLGPVQVTQLINTDDAVVLDVRADGEFRQGHIINAINIPESQLSTKAADIDKYKSRAVITVCRTGQLSAKAAAALKQLGFEQVHTLTGGLLAWEAASMPLTKK
jgi:rhodanese-related sulfurtransferase